MTRRLAVLLAVCLAGAALSAGAQAPAPKSAATPPSAGAVLPSRFDPARDPEADLAAALVQAKREGKRVMVDVGGEWCPWCHILDRFLARDATSKALVDAHYVWLKVNYSKENANAAFLARWPKVAGYPHLFVLDASGKLLHSQDTGALEAGKDYDVGKLRAFLRQWAGVQGA